MAPRSCRVDQVSHLPGRDPALNPRPDELEAVVRRRQPVGRITGVLLRPDLQPVRKAHRPPDAALIREPHRGGSGLLRGFLSARGPRGLSCRTPPPSGFGRHRTALPRRCGVGRRLRDRTWPQSGRREEERRPRASPERSPEDLVGRSTPCRLQALDLTLPVGDCLCYNTHGFFSAAARSSAVTISAVARSLDRSLPRFGRGPRRSSAMPRSRAAAASTTRPARCPRRGRAPRSGGRPSPRAPRPCPRPTPTAAPMAAVARGSARSGPRGSGRRCPRAGGAGGRAGGRLLKARTQGSCPAPVEPYPMIRTRTSDSVRRSRRR